MKSVISENSFDAQNVPYPRLMKSMDNDGIIVLFSGPSIGTVVFSGKSSYTIGAYAADWYVDNFEDIADAVTITLSNG